MSFDVIGSDITKTVIASDITQNVIAFDSASITIDKNWGGKHVQEQSCSLNEGYKK